MGRFGFPDSTGLAVGFALLILSGAYAAIGLGQKPPLDSPNGVYIGSFLDDFYLWLRMATLDTGPLSYSDLPPVLVFARFLAPLSLLVLGGSALVEALRDRFEVLTVRLKRQVIVCGSGDLAWSTAMKRGPGTVLLTTDAPRGMSLSLRGVRVLDLDPRSPSSFEYLAASDASEVLILDDRPDWNREILSAVVEVCGRNTNTTRVVVQKAGIATVEVPVHDCVAVHAVDFDRVISNALLESLLAEIDSDSASWQDSIVVVAEAVLGATIIEELCRSLNIRALDRGRESPPRISLVAEGAEEAVSRLELRERLVGNRYPVRHITARASEVTTPRVWEATRPPDSDNGRRFMIVALPSDSLTAACLEQIEVGRSSGSKPPRIIAGMRSSSAAKQERASSQQSSSSRLGVVDLSRAIEKAMEWSDDAESFAEGQGADTAAAAPETGSGTYVCRWPEVSVAIAEVGCRFETSGNPHRSKRILYVAGGVESLSDQAVGEATNILEGAVGIDERYRSILKSELWPTEIHSGMTHSGELSFNGAPAAAKSLCEKLERLHGFPGASRFCEWGPGKGEENSIQQPIEMWKHLLDRRRPQLSVATLILPGGRITMQEIELACMLGAPVGLLDLSTVQHPSFDFSRARVPPVVLPPDPMTVREFLRSCWRPPEWLFDEDEIHVTSDEPSGRRIHREHRPEFDPAEPSGVETMPASLVFSRVEKDKHAVAKLEEAGINKAAEETLAQWLLRGADELENVLDEGKNSSFIEVMAELEHGRWHLERTRKGWIRGIRDTEALRRESLVPWLHPDLSEKIKGLDTEAVFELPSTLRALSRHIDMDERRQV